MSSKGTGYRNIVLISQISISVMVPTFLCLAIGLWLDKRFQTWFTLPLLFIGIAAGCRNAYVLAMDTIRQDEYKRRREQEKEIQEKINRANEKEIQHDDAGHKS